MRKTPLILSDAPRARGRLSCRGMFYDNYFAQSCILPFLVKYRGIWRLFYNHNHIMVLSWETSLDDDRTHAVE